jgi:hypothetical protein
MAYPAETWIKAKKDYESGNFSIPDLKEKYGISESSFEKTIADENWIKGALKPKIEEKIERDMIKLFAKKGFPPEKIIDRVTEGFNAVRTVTKGNGETVLEVDHNARVKYIQEANKMMGNYSAEKQILSGDPNNPLQIQSITRKIIK